MRHVRNGLVNNDGYESWYSTYSSSTIQHEKEEELRIFSHFLVIWDEARLLLRLRPLATK